MKFLKPILHKISLSFVNSLKQKVFSYSYFLLVNNCFWNCEGVMFLSLLN
jgi:hypothetical protein